MSTSQWLAFFLLAATAVPTRSEQPHCPGNVESVPFGLLNRYQIIVAVSVSHSGHFNFLLDTGTDMTVVDPALAAELVLNTKRAAGVAGVGFLTSTPLVQLDLLEVGAHAVANQQVLVFDFQDSHSVDLRTMRGVLAEAIYSAGTITNNASSTQCLGFQWSRSALEWSP